MSSVKIIAIGKIKEEHHLHIINDYLKRIKRYSKIKSIEIKESTLTESDPKKTLNYYTSEINSHITAGDYQIILDRKGTNYSSEDFAKRVIEKNQYNGKTLTFIIGGSIGLPEEIRRQANEALSFSKLTFPHKLFRIIFLEQLYRAFTILNSKKYHK